VKTVHIVKNKSLKKMERMVS